LAHREELSAGWVNSSKGFSLVELMFALVILVFASAAGMAALSYLIQNARNLEKEADETDSALSFQRYFNLTKMRTISGSNLYLKQAVINEILTGSALTASWLTLPPGKRVYGGVQVVGSTAAGKKLILTAGNASGTSLAASTDPVGVVVMWSTTRSNANVVQGAATATSVVPDLVNLQRPHDFGAANCGTTNCNLFVDMTGTALIDTFPVGSFIAVSTVAGIQVLKVQATADTISVPAYGRIEFSTMPGNYDLGYKIDEMAIDLIPPGSVVSPFYLLLIGADSSRDAVVAQEVRTSTNQNVSFVTVAKVNRLQVIDRALNQSITDLATPGFDFPIYSSRYGLILNIERTNFTGIKSPFDVNIQF
jgi:prepilin-type N-terminal cleavage/methylation domain-containing protein